MASKVGRHEHCTVIAQSQEPFDSAGPDLHRRIMCQCVKQRTGLFGADAAQAGRRHGSYPCVLISERMRERRDATWLALKLTGTLVTAVTSPFSTASTPEFCGRI